jgi:hypothetical protein
MGAYFTSRDADVSRVLSRYFLLADSVLWKEEFEGRRVVVELSGTNQVIDTEVVREYH